MRSYYLYHPARSEITLPYVTFCVENFPLLRVGLNEINVLRHTPNFRVSFLNRVKFD
jgi:hypothetical protein